MLASDARFVTNQLCACGRTSKSTSQVFDQMVGGVKTTQAKLREGETAKLWKFDSKKWKNGKWSRAKNRDS